MSSEDPAVVSVELRPGDDVRVDPGGWEELAQIVREELSADGIGDELLADAIRDLQFGDGEGAYWAYDGSRWWRWAEPTWVEGRPSGPLRPRPFTMEVMLAGEPEAGDDGDLDGDDFDDGAETDTFTEPEPYSPTNLVPEDGLMAWSEPDPQRPPDATLDPGLDVMAIEWRDDGWCQVRCSNDWTTWVDGRLLLAVPTTGV